MARLSTLFFLLTIINFVNVNGGGQLKSAKTPLLPHSYEASIRFIDRHICGGAIIGPIHVLTAAHCFYQNNAKFPDPMFKYMSVVVGFNADLSVGGQSYKIKNITTHGDLIDESDDSWIRDIAVITLESEITYSKLVRAIDLPVANANENTVAKTSIWNSPVDSLHSIEVVLLSHERCMHQLKEKYLGQHDGKICGSTPQRNLCLTNHGSPLVQNDKVIGIASSSEGCRNGQPDVFTNVYRSLYIIKKALLLSYNETQLAADYPKLGEMDDASLARERSVVQMGY